MYYVISTDYVGPNQSDDRYLNVDRVDIQTVPEQESAGDWSVTAHGEHTTIEAARAKVAEVTDGKYRENPVLLADLNKDWLDSGPIVESYLVGEREQLGAEATTMMCDVMTEDVTADTADAEIERMIEEAADELRRPEAAGAEIDADALRHMLIGARDDAIAERDDDDE